MLSATSSGNPAASFFLLPLLLGGLFYFVLLRPQQRRAKEQRALVASVEVGDLILIAGAGIYGTVMSIDEEEGTVSVEIAPGTQITMLRGGIARRVVDDESYYDEDDAQDDEDQQHPDTDPPDPTDHPDQPGQIKEL